MALPSPSPAHLSQRQGRCVQERRLYHVRPSDWLVVADGVHLTVRIVLRHVVLWRVGTQESRIDHLTPQSYARRRNGSGGSPAECPNSSLEMRAVATAAV